MRGEQRLFPFHEVVRMRGETFNPDGDDHRVKRQVDAHQRDGDTDGLLKALEEHRAQQRHQDESRRDRVAGHEAMRIGILDEVGRGVGGGQGDGDDEIGGREAEQREDEKLALPPGQQVFEHGDGAFAAGAFGGNAPVDRQCAEEGQEHEHEGRNWRERASGERGDAGLVAEGGKVVDAG